MEIPPQLSSLQHPPPVNRKRTREQLSEPTQQALQQAFCSFPRTEASLGDARSLGLGNIRMPAIHRYRGDGFDMRRPVMSTQQSQNEAHNVIDLTEDAPSPTFAPQTNVHYLNRRRSPPPPSRARRGPRYEREIIDAEAVGGASTAAVDLRESSPEVQFIRAEPRIHSGRSHSHRATDRTALTPANLSRLPHDSPEQLQARLLPIPNLAPFFMSSSRRPPRAELVHVGPHIHGNFDPPEFNFGLQGFNLEHPSWPVEVPRRLPTYDAPPPPRAGFTRDLKEDDELICPNCDDELGVGRDEVKRQVWTVKGCGHVYCGECARNRLASPKKPGPTPRVKSLKKCVAGECGKTISKSNLIQVYL